MNKLTEEERNALEMAAYHSAISGASFADVVEAASNVSRAEGYAVDLAPAKVKP